MRARPSVSKEITTRFIARLALLWWSRTEPAMFPRYVCVSKPGRGEKCVTLLSARGKERPLKGEFENFSTLVGQKFLKFNTISP